MKAYKDYKVPFTQIPNEIIDSDRLSPGAKWVFSYIASKPDGWKFYISDIVKHSNESKYKVQKYIKELEEEGYLKRIRKQNEKGQFVSWDYHLQLKDQESIIRKPDDGKMTTTEKTDGRKIAPYSNTNISNTNKDNNKEKESIKEKEKTENIRSLTENTLPISETSKNIETSKKQETSKEEPTKKKSFNEKENKNKAIIEEVIAYLNEKTGKHFTPKNKETVKFINGRLSEGYTVSDLKMVIDNRCEKWLNDEKMNEYLRPSTLFRPSNFEAYYNDVLSMKEKAVSEKEQEVIESFRGLLTPPSLPPKQALEQFKKDNNIVFMTESDFKKFEQWYKTKIDEWLKKLEEKRKKDMEVILNERAKNQTNVRTERYHRDFVKSRKF